MRGVNETGEGVCLCTTNRLLLIYIYIHIYTYLSPPPCVHRGLALLALFSSRSFPLHSPTASSFSLPFPCFVESSSSALASARGSTTVFRGVNKVDAGANSVYFALFFQKNVCARERTSAYRGKCGQTTSFYFYVSSFSSFFIPLNRFPGVNVLSLGCYLTLPSSYLRILLFLFSFLFFFFPLLLRWENSQFND